MARFEWLKKWFYNSTILPHRKVLSGVLGFIAAILPLAVGRTSEQSSAKIFVWAFVVLLLALLIVRPSEFKELKFDRSRWAILSLSVFGYGLGALVYHERGWFAWLWNQFIKINEPQEWLLVSLFLLGVMLGFFVVRNWSKEQQEFMTSVTAVLGAAFFAGILGTLAQSRTLPVQQANTQPQPAASPTQPTPAPTPTPATPQGTPVRRATNQAITTESPGASPVTTAPSPAITTASSATAAASPATANQSLLNTDKLDPISTFAFYALGFTLSGALNLIAFAILVSHYSRTESTTSRAVIDFLYGSDKAKAIDGYFLKNFEQDPNYAKVKLLNALTAYREVIKTEFARKMTLRKQQHEHQQPLSPAGSPLEYDDSSPYLDGSPLEFEGSPPSSPPDEPQQQPFDYFELISIESRESRDNPVGPPTLNPTYEVMFRKLKNQEEIKPEMFRVAISMRWEDNLEYIVAPGEYRKSFPYHGSVAGMALAVRRTIVMDRDRFKAFRTQEYNQGKTPNEVNQPRGLHKIDFLSYVVTPMSSSYGKQEETALGVLYLDSKLFACPKKVLPEGSTKYFDTDPSKDIYKAKRDLNGLDDFAAYACNLYEQDDKNILYLESMRAAIVPLLELYKKCRTGAT